MPLLKDLYFRCKRVWAAMRTPAESIHDTRDRFIVRQFHKKRMPSMAQVRYLFHFFSKRERIIFAVTFGVAFLTATLWATSALEARRVTIPSHGGEYTEGVVGRPQFINPLYSTANEADQDLTRLIFSGLVRYDKNQRVQPDLALRYEINPEQTLYTFVIRDDVRWHDGEKVTVDDVLFTYKLIQEPRVASPLRFAFQGVEVTKVDERTLQFKLEKPFAPFLASLTVGIIPEHVWSEVSFEDMPLSRFNIKPVGSGPYLLQNVLRESRGSISRVELKAFDAYYGAIPYITNLNFAFFASLDEAVQGLVEQKVEGLHFLPYTAREKVERKSLHMLSLQLSQYTSVFFNQKNNEALSALSVRKALAHAVDKKRLVEEVLKSDAHVIEGPVLPGFPGYDSAVQGYEYNTSRAKELLKEAGWEQIDRAAAIQLKMKKEISQLPTSTLTAAFLVEMASSTEVSGTVNPPPVLESEGEESQEKPLDPVEALRRDVEASLHEAQTIFWKKGEALLEVPLTTVNVPELTKMAELISGFWQQVGVIAPVEVVDTRSVIKDTLRPRDYSALLYGSLVGADPDLFPFWHSSQADYPGLNLSQYGDRDIDVVLVEARSATSTAVRAKDYAQLQKLMIDRVPALFLYQPTYTHVLGKKVQGVGQKIITTPSDRFADISDWYVETDKVWK